MNEQEKQATITALRLLAATSKSKKRLKQRLQEKGYPGEIIEGTLARLERDGILNDRNFALSVFQTFSNYRVSGKKRIAFEMQKRGVEGKLVEEILGSYGPEEEREKATELAKIKFSRWQKLEPMTRRKKIYDFLIRRGFDFPLSRDIVERLEREI